MADPVLQQEGPAGPLPATVGVIGKDERFSHVSEAYGAWFRREPAWFVGRLVEESVGADAYATVGPPLKAALAGRTQAFEAEVAFPVGRRTVRARYVPQRDRAGEVTGCVALAEDITGLPPLQRLSHLDDLEDFTENANVAMHWVDGAGRIIWANRAELEMLGYEAHEYIGQSIQAFHCDAPTIARFLEVLAGNGRLDAREARLRRKDGSIAHVLVSSSARFEGGRFLHTRCFTFDNTARKEAERLAAARTAQQAALARLGALALAAGSVQALAEAAVETVAQTLRHHAVALLRVDGGAFAVEAAHGWSEAPAGSRIPLEAAPLAAWTLQARGSVTAPDLAAEARFRPTPAMQAAGLRAGLAAPVGPAASPWGVVASHSVRPLGPEDGDAAFLETVANLVAGAVTRLHREAALVREADRAAARERQQAATTRLARVALGAKDVRSLCGMAAACVASTLRHEYAAVLQWHEGEGVTELLGQAGWGPETLGNRTPATPDTHIGHILALGREVVVEDFAAETRFRGHSILRTKGVVSGLGVPIPGAGRPWGVITTHATHRIPYVAEDPDFLHTVAGIVAGGVARIAKEGEARRAHERLREADARKSQFLNLVAHDLRTPLTPIQLRLALLRRRLGDGAGPDIDVLERNLQRLDGLVSQLLDVARITDGRIRLDRQEADLARLARETVATFAEQARAAGIALEVEAECTAAVVDEARIQQVLVNLVSNALKFTPAGGRVHVACRAAGGAAAIEVRDTGAGLTPQQMAGLFEPFSQPAGGAKGGYGLGLHAARTLVELHGGTLVAASGGPGLGATFTVTLPTRPDGPVRANPQAAAEAAPAARTVMLVDDEPDIAQSLADWLASSIPTATFTMETSPVAALDHMAAAPPAVVVSDYRMPAMNGLQFVEAARARHPATRFLLVTGYPEADLERRAKLAGVEAVLRKPVDAERLQHLVQDLLDGAHAG